ncbi:guanylate-binding protein 1-like isoform X2 [Protopterus annectens]|nr:guanylate-binding protein 1-like isoform X2 [Protopterus annectens]
MFVYNSMGTIDQNALDKLHYVTELTECIKVKSCNSKDEDDSFHFSRFFPAFVWTVRDFILELKLDGHPITENEYLEHALQLRPGYGAKVQKYNFPRQCIRSYFPSRKCFVFERPVSCVEKLRKLEEVSENELETSFVKQAKEFCHYVFETAKTKTLHGGHNVTGTLLGNLAVTYVDAIRSGAVPCLENAVVALAQIENSAAVRQAHEHYMKEMERLVKFPTATIEEFSELHAVCGKEAIQVFMNRSFKDDDRTHQGELMRVINLSYENFRQKNEQESANLCTKVITDVSKTLEERITMGYYSKSGGYRCFIEDQEKMIKDYKASIVKGIKLEDVLNDFLKEKEIIAQTILLADNTLTEKEKQIEAERIKAEATQQEMKVMEKNQEALQQMVVDQERSYQENVQQLMEKMEVDRGKLLEEQKRVLAQKLKEQETLLKSGFDEQADRMEAQIRDLRRDLDQTQSSSWLSDALDALGTVATCFLPGIVGKGIGLATKLFSRLF